MNKNKLLGINTDLDTEVLVCLEEYGFNVNVSFSDYDAVVIDTGYLIRNYEESPLSPYQNKKLLSKNDSHRIVEEFHVLYKQIIDYLKQGKTIFIIIGNNENCFIYNDSLGINDKEIFDTYSFLPFNFDITNLTGERYVQCGNNQYKEFFDNTGSLIRYSAQFTLENAVPLLKVPNSDKMISAEMPYKNGRIVLLPSVEYDYCGEDDEEYEKNKRLYSVELYKLVDKIYNSDSDFIMPKWVNDFYILEEKQQQEKYKSDLLKLEKLKKRIEKEKENLEETQRYKGLLTETGTSLEGIAKKVLLEIGFKLHETESGRSDIIASYKDQNIVAEVKGVTKSAAEKHAAQLEKWVSQFIEENEVTPKALLIVNAFKDTPVFERTEDVFPKQMLKYSEAREHALISTTQLLFLYIEIITNPDKKDDLIAELLSTVGVYNKYENITEYLKPITKEDK